MTKMSQPFMSYENAELRFYHMKSNFMTSSDYRSGQIKSRTALHSRCRTTEGLNLGMGCTIRQKMVTVQELFNTNPFDVIYFILVSK
jgi:hypothetical protein